MSTGFPYHPALDGLRGVAVAGVVAYHFGWIGGGFLGVDAFFVLSGFLITSLLLAEQAATGRIALGAFWARRARRLLPALLALVVVLVIVAPGALTRPDIAGTLGYVANWQRIWSTDSYFTLFDAPSPLRHVWSLAIEEQFYVVWPLVVVAVGARRRVLAVVCVAGIAASALAMAAWFDPVDPSRVYYGTDTRAHLLLVGALLAVAGTVRLPALAGAAALAAALAALVLASDHADALYRGGMLAHALVVAVVISVVTTKPRAWPAQLLGVAPLRVLGRVSYGVYLWHWPVLVLVTPAWAGVDGWRLTAVRLTLITTAVATSYLVVERPVRAWSLPARPALAGSAVVLGATACVALVVVPGADPTSRVFLTDAPPVDDVKVPPTDRPAAPATAVDAARPVRKIAVVGDSVAATVAYGLDAVAAEHGVDVVSVAMPGCGIAAGTALTEDGHAFEWSADCVPAVAAVQDEMIATEDPDVVVWLSTWELSDREEGGRHVRFFTRAHDAALHGAIVERLDRLTARGARVVLLAPAPSAPNDRPFDAPPERYAHYRDLLRDVEHASRPGFVDLMPIVCPGGPPCPAEVDGLRLRPDGFHFTEESSVWLARRLLQPGVVLPQ